MDNKTVLDCFLKSVDLYPERPALKIAGMVWSYESLWKLSCIVSKKLRDSSYHSSNVVALFAARSIHAYAGVLGILSSNKAYMPINTKYPIERIKKMMSASNCKLAVVDREFIKRYGANIAEVLKDANVAVIDITDVEKEIQSEAELLEYRLVERMSVTSDQSGAYLLFTSGTTGEPKGIMISHANLYSYISFVKKKYPIEPQDRCSQAFDLTFDPSVHDLFVTWSSGACLCVPSANDLLLPLEFIRKSNLTVWYSVPSIAMRMQQRGVLKKDCLATLKYSIFSGEALQERIVDAWQQAAPDSIIINYYGPTEVTINITDYQWSGRIYEKHVRNGIVPIGKVFETHEYKIVNESLQEVQRGEIGELIVAGPQVSSGYINNIEKTKEVFVRIDGSSEAWYRTGDLVSERSDGVLFFIGRVDHQIKIRGYRVELGEIEEIIRSIPGVVDAVVVPREGSLGIAESLVAFIVAQEEAVPDNITSVYKLHLPEYMIPSKNVILKSFPLTNSGKIDRSELCKMM